MLLTVVVDANPLLAALLGGYARTILFDPRFYFLTTAFTIIEVRRYLGRVSTMSGVPESEIEAALALIPVTVREQSFYRAMIAEARRRIGHIDPDDVEILALTLYAHSPLWTNDKHFSQVTPPVHLLRTRDFIL